MSRELSKFATWASFYLDWEHKDPCCSLHTDLYSMERKPGGRYVLVAARNTGKSVISVREYLLYELCTGHDNLQYVLVISNTAELVKEHLAWIREEFDTNPEIRRDFGGKISKVTWNSYGVFIRRSDGTTLRIRVKGSNASVRGFHPKVIIVDDLENDRLVASEARREYLRDWFWKALYPSLDRYGWIMVIGTPINELSILFELEQSPGWEVMKYPAIGNDGAALWPIRWPLEHLAELRLQMGEKRFAAEYLLQAISLDEAIFRRQWFRLYDPVGDQFREDARFGFVTLTAIDPAFSGKDKADYTAIVTLSMPKWCLTKDESEWRTYVRMVSRGHFTTDETIRRFDQHRKTFKSDRILVEANVAQILLVERLQTHIEIEGDISLKIEPVVHDASTGDKYTRARSVQHFFQRGGVFFNPEDPAQVDTMNELAWFSPLNRTSQSKKDDRVDAIVMALRAFRQRIKGEVHRQSGRRIQSGVGVGW